MARVGAAASTRVPRKFRFRFGDKRNARWLVPAPRCLALPVAVKRNRFLVALCVFILGMTKFLNRSCPYTYARNPRLARRDSVFLGFERFAIVKREHHFGPNFTKCGSLSAQVDNNKGFRALACLPILPLSQSTAPILSALLPKLPPACLPQLAHNSCHTRLPPARINSSNTLHMRQGVRLTHLGGRNGIMGT